jgi:hypothetical protein
MVGKGKWSIRASGRSAMDNVPGRAEAEGQETDILSGSTE